MCSADDAIGWLEIIAARSAPRDQKRAAALREAALGETTAQSEGGAEPYSRDLCVAGAVCLMIECHSMSAFRSKSRVAPRSGGAKRERENLP